MTKDAIKPTNTVTINVVAPNNIKDSLYNGNTEVLKKNMISNDNTKSKGFVLP